VAHLDRDRVALGDRVQDLEVVAPRPGLEELVVDRDVGRPRKGPPASEGGDCQVASSVIIAFARTSSPFEIAVRKSIAVCLLRAADMGTSL